MARRGGVRKASLNSPKQGVEPKANPSNLIMAGSGASLDDMIKSVKQGLLITRFWYIRSLNPRIISFTGLMAHFSSRTARSPGQ
jgi:predicted Zn-dependent protease